MRILTSLACALLLAGCALPPAGLAPAPEAAASTTRLALRLASLAPEPARGLLATLRRWQPADVAGYKVKLAKRDGGSWAPLGGTTDVPGPSPDGPIVVTYADLASGAEYRVSVEAWGAPGGGAPSTLLNADTPCEVVLDLRDTGDDARPVLERTALVRLDGTPFAGRVALKPTALPAGTAMIIGEVWLQGGSEPVATRITTYLGTTFTFADLAVGPTYVFKLRALDGAGDLLAAATSPPQRFDPQAVELESVVPLSLAIDP